MILNVIIFDTDVGEVCFAIDLDYQLQSDASEIDGLGWNRNFQAKKSWADVRHKKIGQQVQTYWPFEFFEHHLWR